MKIGLVRRGFSASGGAEHYLQRFLGALASTNHTAVLFGSPGWPRSGNWLQSSEFHPVPGRSPRAFASALAALRPEDRCDLLFSLERVWKCDCYRAGDGVHRAWLARRAAVEPGWKSWARDAFNFKHRQLLVLEEALLGPGRGAGAVIANSRLVQEEILDYYGGPAERVRVIYNGLPASAFQPPAPGARERKRSLLGLAETDFVVLFAGSGWERKGLRYALTAVGEMAAAPRPVLLVAGEGRLELGKVSPAALDRAHFLGPVTEMQSVYAAADAFVLPTLYDPFSNACLEALAAGLPVITTRANGFAEILAPGTDGAVVEHALDIAGLADALAAWADAARRRDTRPARLASAARFTIEENLARTLRFFEDELALLGRGKRTLSPGGAI